MSRSALGAALAATALLLAPAVPGQDEREMTDLIGGQWVTGQSAAQLDLLRGAGLRIVDLEVQTISPLTFRAALVANVNAFARTWYWYPNLTAAEVAIKLVQQRARLTEVEPFVVNGEVRYAAVMVDNQGANQKQAYFHLTTTLPVLSQHITDNNARLYDLDSFVLDNVRYYTALSIKNTGVDARSWWWYLGRSTAQVETLLAQNNCRLIDIERTGTNVYDVVMQAKGSTRSWHAWGVTAVQVDEMLGKKGARLIDLEAHAPGSANTLYDVTMINSADPVAARVGEMMRTASDGWPGLFLKQVGSPATVVNLNSARQFEPDSLLSTLVLAQTLRWVEQGFLALSTMRSLYYGDPGTGARCLVDVNPVTETTAQVLRWMMASHNPSAKHWVNYFGTGMLNTLAANFGMAGTSVMSHLGCGANRMTLADFGRLHDAVQAGYLTTQRPTFLDVMPQAFYGSGFAQGRLKDVIDAESFYAGLNAQQRTVFINSVRAFSTWGSMTDFSGAQRCWGGRVFVPFWNNSGVYYRDYVVGAFMADASNGTAAASAAAIGAAEVLREVIRSAMMTLRNHVPGAHTAFGTACNSGPAMALAGSDDPSIGLPVTYTLTNGHPGAPACQVFGASKTMWGGLPLPLDLGFLGATNCRLWVDVQLVLNRIVDATGKFTTTFPIPLSAALVGNAIYTQAACWAPGLNPANLAFSTALETRIGGQLQ